MNYKQAKQILSDYSLYVQNLYPQGFPDHIEIKYDPINVLGDISPKTIWQNNSNR